MGEGQEMRVRRVVGVRSEKTEGSGQQRVGWVGAAGTRGWEGMLGYRRGYWVGRGYRKGRVAPWQRSERDWLPRLAWHAPRVPR